MRCESCGKPATQIREEFSYCERCHSKRFSTIKINGVEKPFLIVLKEQLDKMGLSRKEGETIDQWSKRCRAVTPKQYGGLA
jgi:DNA-directed RNA polymerase subunit RPC12/RpoP